jgi:hypothetical protein
VPKYDYHCPSNGMTLEASHPMRESVETWGQLCSLMGADPGNTPADAPVERAIHGVMAITSSRGGPGPAPSGGSCGAGCACHPH